MTDFETRIDQAISTAVAEQLQEQRRMRELVDRVEELLVTLSDGMADLAGQVGATTRLADRQRQLDEVVASAVDRIEAELVQRADQVLRDLSARAEEVLSGLQQAMSAERVEPGTMPTSPPPPPPAPGR